MVSTLNARCYKYFVLKRNKIGCIELALRAEMWLQKYYSQECYNSAGMIRFDLSGNANFQQSFVSLECSQCLNQIPDILTSWYDTAAATPPTTTNIFNFSKYLITLKKFDINSEK